MEKTPQKTTLVIFYKVITGTKMLLTRYYENLDFQTHIHKKKEIIIIYFFHF